MKSVLFVSNGYGEDSIAISIVAALNHKMPNLTIYALPLVGAGNSYKSVKCELVGTRTVMPSGGMIPGNLGNLIKDTKSGLFKLTFDQLKSIKQFSAKSSVTVSVGDIYPLILTSLVAKTPKILVATAKSDYVSPHNLFEKIWMREFATRVFVRDEPTAEHLRKDKVNAIWVGNAMMDCLQESGYDFELKKDQFLTAIFPGSRDASYRDMPYILNALEIIDRDLEHRAVFAAAIAPSIDKQHFADSFKEMGWLSIKRSEERTDLYKDSINIMLLTGHVGDLLKNCKMVIGQAGTANEQAAGLGKPVVTFDSFGKTGEMGWYRKRQKKLLGDAISVVDRDSLKVAYEFKKIFTTPELYNAMSRQGIERMGPAGGAEKMADYIMTFLNQE